MKCFVDANQTTISYVCRNEFAGIVKLEQILTARAAEEEAVAYAFNNFPQVEEVLTDCQGIIKKMNKLYNPKKVTWVRRNCNQAGKILR